MRLRRAGKPRGLRFQKILQNQKHVAVRPGLYYKLSYAKKNQAALRKEKPIMGKASRIILGLRAAGWANDEILDFILWIAAGEEQYRPRSSKQQPSR